MAVSILSTLIKGLSEASKSELADTTDLIIEGDVTKRTRLATLAEWIRGKLGIGTASSLTTTSKEVVGAINELNTKRSNVPSTLNALWTYGFRIMGYGIIVPIPTNGKLTITKGEIYDNTSKWYEMKYSAQTTVGGQINYIFQTTVDGATLDFGRAYLVRITGMIQ